jgi:hypothetical protein
MTFFLQGKSASHMFFSRKAWSHTRRFQTGWNSRKQILQHSLWDNTEIRIIKKKRLWGDGRSIYCRGKGMGGGWQDAGQGLGILSQGGIP